MSQSPNTKALLVRQHQARSALDRNSPLHKKNAAWVRFFSDAYPDVEELHPDIKQRLRREFEAQYIPDD